MLQPLNVARGCGGRLPRTTAGLFGNLGLQFLADLGQRMQHRLGDLSEHMELAHLMWDPREDLRQRLWIQGRAVGRDAFHFQAPTLQLVAEGVKEGADIVLCGVFFQHPVSQARKVMVIDETEDTEGAIVQLIDGDVAAEGL